MTETPKAPAGRVVIELTADNVLVMETYTNGQRSRVTLNRGQEYWEILDELSMQRKVAQSAAERKQEVEAKASRQRHNRVWTTAANTPGQGVAFAKNVIGGDVPPGYGKYFDKKTLKEERKAKKPETIMHIDDMIALL